jgi:hypothetical protein
VCCKADRRFRPKLSSYVIVKVAVRKQLVIRLRLRLAAAATEIALSQCNDLAPVRVRGTKVSRRTDILTPLCPPAVGAGA